MKKKKLRLKKTVIFKLVIMAFILVMLILFYASFYIYSNNRKINYFSNKKDYSYIVINKMSDSFATISNKQLHFVKDKNNELYVIAIYKKDISKYQSIIDYTYGKKDTSKNKKVYVYPIKNSDAIKNVSIKYINKFLPFDERIDLDLDNYDKYLSKYYLDTTYKTYYKFNYIVFILFLLVIIIIFIIISYILKKKNEKLENII